MEFRIKGTKKKTGNKLVSKWFNAASYTIEGMQMLCEIISADLNEWLVEWR